MSESPNFARTAALIGDPARALMLQALMSGRALTASELAATAGVARTTASSHLAQLVSGGLVIARTEGRHKYLNLASPSVARALESLMVLAAGQATQAQPIHTGPRDPALREARLCYNHLAGARGVQAHDSLAARGAFAHGPNGLDLTASGRAILAPLGLDPAALAPDPAPQCRLCLDWSERRHHLAGRLGRALLTRMQSLAWVHATPGSRTLHFSPSGRAAFDRSFPLPDGCYPLDATDD